MVSKVFFAYDYDNDSDRAAHLKNKWDNSKNIEVGGMVDGQSWVDLKSQGMTAIRSWMHHELYDSSVTIILIGHDTATDEWVRHAIEESYQQGNGFLGIHVHNLPDHNGTYINKGSSPFHDKYPWVMHYDWNVLGGNDLESWILEAYQQVTHPLFKHR